MSFKKCSSEFHIEGRTCNILFFTTFNLALTGLNMRGGSSVKAVHFIIIVKDC